VRKAFTFFLLGFIFAAGCGYTTHSVTFAEKTIFIKPVVNAIKIATEDSKYANYKTFPRLIENELTSALTREFNINGQLKVVNSGADALTLICTIKDYQKESLRYGSSDDVREQRLRLYVTMSLLSNHAATVVVTESEINKTGLVWGDVCDKFLKNGLGQQLDPGEVRLKPGWEDKKDEMAKVFGDDFNKILSLLQQSHTVKEKEVVGETTFFLTGASQKTETAAQVDLVDDTARRITEAVVEDW